MFCFLVVGSWSLGKLHVSVPSPNYFDESLFNNQKEDDNILNAQKAVPLHKQVEDTDVSRDIRLKEIMSRHHRDCSKSTQVQSGIASHTCKDHCKCNAFLACVSG